MNFFTELKRRKTLANGCPFRLKVRNRTCPVRTFARGEKNGLETVAL
jgi:hypothetical protein